VGLLAVVACAIVQKSKASPVYAGMVVVWVAEDKQDKDRRTNYGSSSAVAAVCRNCALVCDVDACVLPSLPHTAG
jgi:hypothetical protein